MLVRAVLFGCLAALFVGGCRDAEPTLRPAPAEPQPPKLHRLAHGHSVQWTAEGRLVYVDPRDGDVWSIRPGAKRSRHLVGAKKSGFRVVVSPTGSRMLLFRKGKAFVARTDGTGLKPLHVPEGAAASWSDDGTKLTFELRRQQQRSIWAVSARGGKPERLFREFGGSVLAWAPDGRMVVRAFQTGEGGSFRATLLFDAEGNPTEIPDISQARFLPDSTIEAIDPDGLLVVLDAQGEILRTFPAGGPVRAFPDYTPDGTLMVYEHDERLWLAFGDWTAPRALADGSCSRPAFSLDGSQIACSLVVTKRDGRKKRPEAFHYVAVIEVPAELR